MVTLGTQRPGDADATRPVLPARSPVAGLKLQLLGGFAVTLDGRPLPVPKAQRKLLALLGLRRTTSRAEVAGTLWPEVTDARALGSLRTTLWRIASLGPATGPLVYLD